jgi:16S rRNA (guanine527-N7)-methyltransferase
MNQANSLDLAALLRQGIADLHINVPGFASLTLSATQQEQLLNFVGLLAKWNKTYNLTAVRDPAQMISHHLLDSLAVAPAFAKAKHVLDVGAGGGLPGIVLAIVWPQMQFSLIDIVHKKTAFLTQVKAELGLSNVKIYTGRVEQLPADKQFDVITSRAFAELADFVHGAGHLLTEGGQFLAMKGQLPTQEISVLPAQWQVSAITPVKVAQLDAERHLIHIQRANHASSSCSPISSNHPT